MSQCVAAESATNMGFIDSANILLNRAIFNSTLPLLSSYRLAGYIYIYIYIYIYVYIYMYVR